MQTGEDIMGPVAAEQEPENGAFPGDHLLDDPAVMEMQPARSQRELDLEALDFNQRGYSIRQIARLQRIHANTAFHRVRRGRCIEQQEPLQAEGQSLHAEASKLRRLQQALFPAAESGDMRATQMVVRIWDKLWRLGKFVRDEQASAELRRMSGTTPTDGPAALWAKAPGMRPERAVEPPLWDDDANGKIPWDLMAELLPHRTADLAALRMEYGAAVEAEDSHLEQQQTAANDCGAGVPPAVPETACPEESPGAPRSPSAPGQTEPMGVSHPTPMVFGRRRDKLEDCLADLTCRRDGWPTSPPPPTRRNRALQARAKREQRASAARAPREQGASAARAQHEPLASDNVAGTLRVP